MEENEQNEEKQKGAFSENERTILLGFSRSVQALCAAVDRLTTQVMNLTQKT